MPRRTLATLALIAVALILLMLQNGLRSVVSAGDGEVQKQIDDSIAASDSADDTSVAVVDDLSKSSADDLVGTVEGLLPDCVLQLVSDGELVVTVEKGGVAEVAEQLLGSYQSQGGSVLERAGYLDLFGSVWGCVVSGGRWVDVCLVSDAGSGTSRLSVLHFDADEVARELLEGDVYVEGGS